MARFERTVTPSVVNMLLLKGPAGRGVKRACRKGTINELVTLLTGLGVAPLEQEEFEFEFADL